MEIGNKVPGDKGEQTHLLTKERVRTKANTTQKIVTLSKGQGREVVFAAGFGQIRADKI